jgi:hypothetical protein
LRGEADVGVPVLPADMTAALAAADLADNETTIPLG